MLKIDRVKLTKSSDSAAELGSEFDRVFVESIDLKETPQTPSISTQLAIRDGKMATLPLNLIVKGDLILLRPGQIIPVNCRSMIKNRV